ncbi:copper-binding protein [Bradyrhizobium erythrophlei]|uniref:copper-binding protein n=1 Tax=Bradyrhizobium erythrophlei TaxID=1437360 RepID=UPI0035F0C483
MRAGKIALTSLLGAGLVTSAALAQQSLSGMVTKIDRLAGTISIQQSQGGTVGTTGGVIQDFKVTNGAMLEPIHAGDKVSFSTSESGGKTMIDKLEKQKP